MSTTPRIYVGEVGFLSRFWTVLEAAAIGLYNDNCFGIAKGAAYSALLAFFPILTTIATLLVQANAERVSRTVARLLYDVVPPGTEDVVRQLFNVQGQRPRWLLATGVVLAAWAGSGVMISLMEGFRAIYRIPTGRSFISDRLVAILLVLSASVPLLGASLLLVFGNRAQTWIITTLGIVEDYQDLRGWVRLLWQVLSFLIATAGIVFITSLVYYFGPNRKQRFANVLPGAFVAMALWLIATLGVAWYFRHITDYNVLYGSVGAGLALLVWSYVLAVIAFFGCEFNAALELHRQA
jgi:membrane protein